MAAARACPRHPPVVPPLRARVHVARVDGGVVGALAARRAARVDDRVGHVNRLDAEARCCTTRRCACACRERHAHAIRVDACRGVEAPAARERGVLTTQRRGWRRRRGRWGRGRRRQRRRRGGRGAEGPNVCVMPGKEEVSAGGAARGDGVADLEVGRRAREVDLDRARLLLRREVRACWVDGICARRREGERGRGVRARVDVGSGEWSLESACE